MRCLPTSKPMKPRPSSTEQPPQQCSCTPASPRSQECAPGVRSLCTQAECQSGRLSWDACAGVRLRNVRLGAALRARLSHAFFDAAELSAEAAELELPGWRQPLRLRLRGARVELQQRALPRVRSARPVTVSGAEPGAGLRRPSLWGAALPARQGAEHASCVAGEQAHACVMVEGCMPPLFCLAPSRVTWQPHTCACH